VGFNSSNVPLAVKGTSTADETELGLPLGHHKGSHGLAAAVHISRMNAFRGKRGGGKITIPHRCASGENEFRQGGTVDYLSKEAREGAMGNSAIG